MGGKDATRATALHVRVWPWLCFRDARAGRRDAEIRRHFDLCIPEDSPPSFDAQREETYATIHSAAPFYSTLISGYPVQSGVPPRILCAIFIEMPTPTDDGKTYTFKIRDDVKFHNGDKLTAEGVAASLNKIAFPPQGTLSPRATDFMMVKEYSAGRAHRRHSAEVRHQGLPAGARRSL